MEATNQTEVKKTSLAKLLGSTTKGKQEVLAQTQIVQNTFEAEKYERMSSFALNYYNNGLDYILEKILLQSTMWGEEDKLQGV